MTESEYRQVTGPSLGLNRGPRIAVIYATGVIASGESSSESLSGQVVGSDTMVEYIRKARGDNSIKAIVLRVDSPGGSAIASDVIWREVMLTRNIKPVVASMSDVAASGGYYIAMPAHAIVAEPATLTGSIGVVHAEVRDRRDAEEARDERGRGHQRALRRPLFAGARVLAGGAGQGPGAHAGHLRHVRREGGRWGATPRRSGSTRSAQGRVWTGKQAKELGLVDELGGLERALAIAKQRAKLAPDSEVELVVYPGRKSIYEIVKNPFGSSERTGARRAARDPRSPGAAEPDGAAAALPPRRAAGHHAECVRTGKAQVRLKPDATAKAGRSAGQR